jgi:hypothetical protein
MPGKVYCFNAYNEPMKLHANGFEAGRVAGWSSSAATRYAPVALAVARARHGDGQPGPVFPNDMPTPLRIDWESFSVQTSINLAGLPNVSLDDDLILYIAVNQTTLMTTRGYVLRNGSISPWGLRAEVAESDVPDNMLALLEEARAKIGQSDVPDNMLALLALLRDTRAKVAQSDVPDNMLALLTLLGDVLAKVGQSDVPDNMLALLTLLTDTQGKIGQSDVPDNML